MNQAKIVPAFSSEPEDLSAPATYAIAGRTFIVEPVYQEKTDETIGSILIKLMLKHREEPS